MKSIHYPKARARRLKEQQAEREVLLAHGISKEDIDMLHTYDLEALRGERNYHRHNYSLAELEDCYGELRTELINAPAEDPFANVGGLLEQIENDKLFLALKALKAEDLALVMAVIVNGTQISEYAQDIGVRQPTVTKKMQRILKKLRQATS